MKTAGGEGLLIRLREEEGPGIGMGAEPEGPGRFKEGDLDRLFMPGIGSREGPATGRVGGGGGGGERLFSGRPGGDGERIRFPLPREGGLREENGEVLHCNISINSFVF